jgi:hypothetical protein
MYKIKAMEGYKENVNNGYTWIDGILTLEIVCLSKYSKLFNMITYFFCDKEKKNLRVIPHNINRKDVYYNLCQEATNEKQYYSLSFLSCWVFLGGGDRKYSCLNSGLMTEPCPQTFCFVIVWTGYSVAAQAGLWTMILLFCPHTAGVVGMSYCCQSP